MTDQGAPDWFKGYVAAGGKPTTGGPTAPAISAATGGGSEDVAGYIRSAAAQRGIDPEVAIRVAQSEGGLVPNKTGVFKTGQSFWPFQLHYGGPGYEKFGNVAGMGNSFTAQTGFQPGDPGAWKAATDYALDAAAKNGWGAWYGARNVGVTGYQGINRQAQQTAAPPAQGTAGLSRAREAPPATTAPADAPDWFKGYAAAGGQTSTAAAPAARGGAAASQPSTLSPEAAGKQAVAASWALQQLGSKAYYNLCQRFIEQAYGTGGGYTSAAAAGQALVTHADPSRADVGDLVFFRPDPSNGMAGHAAIYLGNGEMVGATYGGVTRDRIDSPYWSKLLLGFADPPAQWAGNKGASTPAVVQGASALLGTAKATAGVAPPAAAQMGEDTPVWFRGYVAAGGR
jgi:cell wall-associated NlpC family hydrolase